jgi:hypothetical protein
MLCALFQPEIAQLFNHGLQGYEALKPKLRT